MYCHECRGEPKSLMECARCGGVQVQSQVDVRTMMGAEPSYIHGVWRRPCGNCGNTSQPVHPDIKAPSMGMVHGPFMPTPHQIMMGAMGAYDGGYGADI